MSPNGIFVIHSFLWTLHYFLCLFVRDWIIFACRFIVFQQRRTIVGECNSQAHISLPSVLLSRHTAMNNKCWATLRIDRHHKLFAAIQEELLKCACENDDDDDVVAFTPPNSDTNAIAGGTDKSEGGRWSYAPYPGPSETAIRANHFWWLCVANSDVAVASDVDPLTTTSTTTSTSPRGDVALHDVVGVVGVVLSPFGCRAGEMEAYLQVVLVRPSCRRQGVAVAMVRQVLDDLADQQKAKNATGGPAALKLTRVRLHTMVSSVATTQYVTRHTPDLREVEPFTEMMASVKRMYENFGFVTRRNCPRYYANEADGIEMTLDTAQLVRRFGSSTEQTSSHKRARE